MKEAGQEEPVPPGGEPKTRGEPNIARVPRVKPRTPAPATTPPPMTLLLLLRWLPIPPMLLPMLLPAKMMLRGLLLLLMFLMVVTMAVVSSLLSMPVSS